MNECCFGFWFGAALGVRNIGMGSRMEWMHDDERIGSSGSQEEMDLRKQGKKKESQALGRLFFSFFFPFWGFSECMNACFFG